MSEQPLKRRAIVAETHLIVQYFETHPTATVSEMSSYFEITPATYYRWLKDYPDLAERVQEAKVKRRKSMLEKAENILDKALQMDDIDAAKFVIKEYGDHRNRNADNATGNTQIGTININIVKAIKDDNTIEVNAKDISIDLSPSDSDEDDE